MEDLATIGADAPTKELEFGIVSNDSMAIHRAKKDSAEDATDMGNEFIHHQELSSRGSWKE